MSEPLLIAMAGLPGSGKSTLVARLADAIRGVVLSKDVVRAALFPVPFLDYSEAQDHVAMSSVFSAAEYFLRSNPAPPVFLDGRTFCKRGQIDTPRAIALLTRARLRVIECVCSDEVARARITADHVAGTHLAGNRTPDLYDRVKATAVPLDGERLTLDTGVLSLEECVTRAIEYLSM